MSTCDALMERIEEALLADDGNALEEAWYAMYTQHPSKAIQVARIMAPLSRREAIQQ